MAARIRKVIKCDTIDEICPIPATEFNSEQVAEDLPLFHEMKKCWNQV